MMRFTVIFGFVIVAGCIPPEKPAKSAHVTRNVSGQEGAVALEVNGEDLTIEQVRERQEALQTALPANTLERQLAVIADFEILADEAEKRGYGKDVRVVNRVKDELAEEAKRRKIEVDPKADVDEAAVAKAFEAGRNRK